MQRLKSIPDFVLPVVNFSNSRRIPFPITVTFKLREFERRFENCKLFLLQKDPSTGEWIDTTPIAECKFVAKTSEVHAKTKILSSLMVAVSSNSIDKDIITSIPSEVLSTNQGLKLKNWPG